MDGRKSMYDITKGVTVYIWNPYAVSPLQTMNDGTQIPETLFSILISTWQSDGAELTLYSAIQLPFMPKVCDQSVCLMCMPHSPFCSYLLTVETIPELNDPSTPLP